MELIEVKPVRGLSAGEMEVVDAVNAILHEGIVKLTESVKRAARKFMTLAEESREKLRAQSTKAGRDFVDALERVAAGEMYPDLALENGWAAQHLRKLPVDQQERYMRDGIKVYLETADGKGDWTFRMPRDLSRDEIVQVFELSRTTETPVRVRDMGDQKAWVIAKRLQERHDAKHQKETKTLVVPGKYVIKGRRFTPMKTGYTVKELEEILMQMKRLLG